jgi:sarcosine oxidase subunit gamma
MARRGVDAAAIGAALGVSLPTRPGTTTAGALTLIGTGPGNWLAVHAAPPADWAESLRDALTGLASVSDQSGGYRVWRLAGPDARRLLQRGVAIDLDPAAFGAGAAAATQIAHIGVIVWQVDAAPTYDVAHFRSHSNSFRAWFDATAAAL